MTCKSVIVVQKNLIIINTREYIISTTITLLYVMIKFQFDNSNMHAFPDPSRQQQKGAGHARLDLSANSNSDHVPIFLVIVNNAAACQFQREVMSCITGIK